MKPDLYLAAMGRSGSTALANWLTVPDERQVVFIEPEFLAGRIPATLVEQFSDLDLQPPTLAPLPADSGQDLKTWLDNEYRPALEGWKWGFKEVLCTLHERCLDELSPAFVLVTVRDIRDIFYSFIEKHRIQNNENRFSPDWSFEYCRTESHHMAAFVARLENEKRPHLVVRYEDFIASPQTRRNIEQTTGWCGGGDTSRHLSLFKREFEIKRHSQGISSRSVRARQRDLPEMFHARAEELATLCSCYSKRFGYG